MLDVLQDFCRRKIVDDFDIRHDDEHERIVVSVWMDGTSYDDRAVQNVRTRIVEEARREDRPVLLVIAAILDRVVVAYDHDRTLEHQRVRPLDG